MKIAILGCGAMGSVYAAILSTGGNDVLVVDRWADHVAAINERGLRLEGPRGDQTVRIRAYEKAPAERVDLVVIAVKSSDVAVAAREALSLLGPESVVLTIQNGMGSIEAVAEVVGAHRLVVGIASAFGASLRGAGHAHHNAMQAVRIGPYATLSFERVDRVAQVWEAAGFDAKTVPDIAAMQWEKLICNVAYSAPCALSGMTVGEAMDDTYMGPVSRAAATEAWHVARALGIEIAVQDPVEWVRAFGARVFNAKPSALLDHEAGRASEIDFINGAVPRFGATVGVATPVNETLVALVKLKERGLRR